jgi:IclR family mhp operon transcriptional activator
MTEAITLAASPRADRATRPKLRAGDDASLIHGLSKGIRILSLMNERDDVSVAELSRVAGIPRPTVHRIINTLMTEQLVTTSLRRGRYRVAIGARTLSQGYKEPSWLVDIAGPALDRLQRKVTWPSDLATYAAGAMVIRRTTSHHSPLNTVGKHVGARLPMLTTALGLAYLAGCAPDMRGKILETLSDPRNPEHEAARRRPELDRTLERIAADGFAWRDGGASPNSFALAVPVFARGVAAAAVNVILFRSAISVQTATATLLPELKAAADALSRELDACAADLAAL